jgi:hypothetical protein
MAGGKRQSGRHPRGSRTKAKGFKGPSGWKKKRKAFSEIERCRLDGLGAPRVSENKLTFAPPFVFALWEQVGAITLVALGRLGP